VPVNVRYNGRKMVVHTPNSTSPTTDCSHL